MALAMLSACAFLAKAHLYLVKPEAFVTADDQNAVKKAKAIVKQHCPGLKRLLDSSKTNWMQPKIGSCNETEAFGRLIEALQREGIDLGLPPTEARAVWDRFRNKLAHMAYPEGVVEFCGATAAKTLDEARAAIRRLPAFRVHDGRWVCNADRLSLDVLKIADWLCEKVGRCTKLDRIKKLAEWVSEDIEPAPSQDPDRDNH